MSTSARALPVAPSSHKSFERLESQVRSYCRSTPVVFTRASGAELFDLDDTPYLDFLSGAGSLNYGHNHPVLREALLEYISGYGIAHSLDFYTDAKETFLEAFESNVLRPRDLDYVLQFTGPTGTNAVEAAIKLARKITGREAIVTFTNAFHGVSLGALSLTGNVHHRAAAGVSMPGALRCPYDGYLEQDVDTLDFLDKALDDPSSGFGHPAAVIVETVQGEGGLNAASLAWLRRLAEICEQREVLLIVDDIQAGCGRTGYFFSFEAAGIRPDIVTLSKSLSGFGLPLAVTLIARELDAWEPGEHNGTFRGNNHAFVTATAAIEEFWRTNSFCRDVRRKASLLHAHLETLAAESHGALTVKGRGLMVGLGCENGKVAAAIRADAFEHGLIIETSGSRDEVVKCLPPLTITDSQLSQGAAILAASVEGALER
jgi:diaminobutyrate-2-oxoglutarate transaminase